MNPNPCGYYFTTDPNNYAKQEWMSCTTPHSYSMYSCVPAECVREPWAGQRHPICNDNNTFLGSGMTPLTYECTKSTHEAMTVGNSTALSSFPQ